MGLQHHTPQLTHLCDHLLTTMHLNTLYSLTLQTCGTEIKQEHTDQTTPFSPTRTQDTSYKDVHMPHGRKSTSHNWHVLGVNFS